MDLFRNFAFTDQSRNAEGLKEFAEKYCSYLIYGDEIGTETEKEHFQGYAELIKRTRFNALKKQLPEGIHFKHRYAKSTAEQAANYCKKEGKYIEFGTISVPGKRTDLESVCADIIAKKSIKEVALENPTVYVKYSRGLEKLALLTYPKRTEAPKVYWIWGNSGVGKTHYATSRHSQENRYIKDCTKWFDGYHQQEAIIIDDFGGCDHGLLYKDLLRLFDKVEFQGQTKGGYIEINSPFIYVTCDAPISKFWIGNEFDQMDSRCESIHLEGENRRRQICSRGFVPEVAK